MSIDPLLGPVASACLIFLSYRQVEISTWTSCRSIVRSRASSGPATRRPQNVRRHQWGQGQAPTLLAIDSALCLPVPASWFAVRKRSLTFLSLSLSLCSGVRDTVIVEERSGVETSEAETETEETEPDRHDSATATAAASNSDDQPAAPGLCVPSQGHGPTPTTEASSPVSTSTSAKDVNLTNFVESGRCGEGSPRHRRDHRAAGRRNNVGDCAGRDRYALCMYPSLAS